MTSSGQILITGVYRTGSEYLTQLLNLHPHLSATMYRINVLRFVQGKYDPISVAGNYLRALNDILGRTRLRYQITFSVDAVVAAMLSRQKTIDYGLLYDCLMSHLYVTESTRYWAEKCQLLWREIPQFIMMMPNGKSIHILRDPRSVLLSFKNYTHAEKDLYLTAIFNCFDAMQKHFIYLKTLPQDRYMSVQYELLAQSPEKVIKRLWHFIGLDSDIEFDSNKNMIDAYGNAWHANSSFHPNDSKQPYDVNLAITRWKTQLTNEEIALTELVCGDYMEKLGYMRHCSNLPDDNFIYSMTSDVRIINLYHQWKKNGQGIEAFPSDPLDPKTWEVVL